MYNFIKNNQNNKPELDETFSFLDEIDQRRNLSSQSVFPEIYKLK